MALGAAGAAGRRPGWLRGAAGGCSLRLPCSVNVSKLLLLLGEGCDHRMARVLDAQLFGVLCCNGGAGCRPACLLTFTPLRKGGSGSNLPLLYSFACRALPCCFSVLSLRCTRLPDASLPPATTALPLPDCILCPPPMRSVPAALVSTIVLVSLNFDARKVEGLLMWVQDNPRQGSVLFLVRRAGLGLVGPGGARSAAATAATAARRCCFCLARATHRLSSLSQASAHHLLACRVCTPQAWC